MRMIHLVSMGFALACTACGSLAGANGAWVEVRGERFSVEVADDDQERARGLMFRDVLEADHGMLFIHDRQEPLAYWMKNTRIALDILYFDGQARFVSGHYNVPPCNSAQCPSYPSEKPARYVLELNAGQAERLGLKDGDLLTFGPGIPPAR